MPHHINCHDSTLLPFREPGNLCVIGNIPKQVCDTHSFEKRGLTLNGRKSLPRSKRGRACHYLRRGGEIVKAHLPGTEEGVSGWEAGGEAPTETGQAVRLDEVGYGELGDSVEHELNDGRIPSSGRVLPPSLAQGKIIRVQPPTFTRSSPANFRRPTTSLCYLGLPPWRAGAAPASPKRSSVLPQPQQCHPIAPVSGLVDPSWRPSHDAAERFRRRGGSSEDGEEQKAMRERFVAGPDALSRSIDNLARAGWAHLVVGYWGIVVGGMGYWGTWWFSGDHVQGVQMGVSSLAGGSDEI
ncbi:hypothetical protein FPV67DRAFT_1447030 [Lyophyllum atratum]|nr:hypothetical protein FPV67DRAFT_1447030 [Lyophyllum atratum]